MEFVNLLDVCIEGIRFDKSGEVLLSMGGCSFPYSFV